MYFKGLAYIAAIVAGVSSAAKQPNQKAVASPQVPKILQAVNQPKPFSVPNTIQDLVRDMRNQTVNFPPRKNAKGKFAAYGADVCIESYGGFVIVSSNNTNLYDGNAACSQFGFQWAVVEEDNLDNLRQTMDACNAFFGSIKSFNGYEGNTCQVTILGQVFVADLPNEVCANESALFVCQEIPIATETVTDYTTVSTRYTTATVTDVAYPRCPSCKLHTCPFNKNNLYMIKENLPFNQAKCACEELGMELADLDIFNFLDATDVEFQCAGAFKKAWINSWNGDRYNHTCLALSTGVMAPGGSINVPESCHMRLPVLCKADPCWRHCRPCKEEHCPTCPPQCQHGQWRKPCESSEDRECWRHLKPERCPCSSSSSSPSECPCSSSDDHRRRKPHHCPCWTSSSTCDSCPCGPSCSSSSSSSCPCWTSSSTCDSCPCGPSCSSSSSSSSCPCWTSSSTCDSCPCGPSCSSSSSSSSSHHHRRPRRNFAEQPQQKDNAKNGNNNAVAKSPNAVNDFSKKTKADYDCCPHKSHDIHILKSKATWEEAQHACKCYGWRLLDVTHENVEELAELGAKCHLDGLGWIRSWFGFKGGQCRAAIPFAEETVKRQKMTKIPQGHHDYWFSGLFSENDHICEYAKFYVLCQEEHKQPARPTGPVEISTSYVYTTTEVETTVTRVITTVTRTVTLLGK